MNDFYLTDKIFIRNENMYLQKNNKIQKINKNNWHHILNDYGWEKIPLQWVKKLNTYSSFKNKNSRFGMLDCESDGNCFFQCIANALNERDRTKGEEYNYIDIRNIIADSITEEYFQTLIEYYRIMKDANDFDEEWDPYQIKTVDDFKRQIRESGHNYWGDYLLFNLIIKILKLNIFLFNFNEDEKEQTIYNTLNEYNPKYDTIYLLYENNCHFKLIGYFDDNKMISYFTNQNIPEELIQLFDIKFK